MVLKLPRQGELHGHTEVLCDGGVAAGRKKWFGALAVIEEAHGNHSAHGIIDLGAGLDGHAAAGGFAKVRL